MFARLSYLFGMFVMDLRRLQYFVAVAEESGICRAAARLHISQPPLTRQIQGLEEEVGTKLFVRRKKGMQLTEAGRFLVKEARQILSMSQRAVQMTQAVGRGETGLLEIAYVAPVFHGILPRAIRLFRKHFPLAELGIREMDSYQQIQELLDKRIDLGCPGIPFPGLEDQLVFEQVCDAPLYVALPPGHRLARRREVALSLLANDPFVCPARGVRTLLLRLCRSAGFEPRVVQEGNNLACSLELVAAGVGVSLVTDAFPQYLSSEVQFRALPADVPRQPLYIAWHKDNKSPMLQAFVKTFKQTL
jgi:DNA-binding transcriptional LysR family regulator